MPFEIAETESKDNMPPTALLSYMRPKGRGKAVVKGGADYDRTKVKPKLIISVPTVLVIAKSPRFVLLIGTGAEAGKLRLRGVKDGTKNSVKPTEFKAHLLLRFGYVPKLGDDIFDGERCPLKRISDEEYEIDAPFLAGDGAK